MVRSGGGKFPTVGWGESEILLRVFFTGEGKLRRSDFDNSNLCQSYKQLSVNTEHQLNQN